VRGDRLSTVWACKGWIGFGAVAKRSEPTNTTPPNAVLLSAYLNTLLPVLCATKS
jgi:hypothetical protein